MAAEAALKTTVQRMIDAGESEETIAAAIRQATAPTSPMEAARVDRRFGTIQKGGTLDNVIHGVTSAGEAAMVPAAISAGLPLLGPAGAVAARVLTHPAVTGAMGAYEGYQHGGPVGAVVGGALGAEGGKIAGGLVSRLRGILGGVAAAAPEAATAAEVGPLARIRASEFTGDMVARREAVQAQGAASRPPVYQPRPTPSSVPPERMPVASPPAGPAGPPSTVVPPATPPPPVLGPLTTEERQALDGLVKEGHAPADVLRAIQQQRQLVKAAEVPVPTKPKLLAADTKEYLRLRNAGQTHAQAMDLIAAQKDLARRLQLPTAEEARQAVTDRNAAGRWKDDQ